jgi:hypothetical protein
MKKLEFNMKYKIVFTAVTVTPCILVDKNLQSVVLLVFPQ